jgi:hypothetical protein
VETLDPLLTVDQAHARYPFIPKGTFRYWRAVDAGPPSFNVGRRVVYRQSLLDEWVASREAVTTRGGAA